MVLIAHRGDPRHAPENTLASFGRASLRGARAVEMDLRRAADGTWIVFHDPWISRLSYPAIRCLRADGRPIPTLSEALAFCRSRRLEVYLDVKEGRDERSLSLLLQQSGWLRRVRILAGSPASLRRWRRLLPGRPLFWVTGMSSALTPRLIARARRLGLNGLVSYRGKVTRAAVERVHRAGMKLHVWTVRTAADLKRFARMGVDGIMSEVWPPPSSI